VFRKEKEKCIEKKKGKKVWSQKSQAPGQVGGRGERRGQKEKGCGERAERKGYRKNREFDKGREKPCEGDSEKIAARKKRGGRKGWQEEREKDLPWEITILRRGRREGGYRHNISYKEIINLVGKRNEG